MSGKLKSPLRMRAIDAVSSFPYIQHLFHLSFLSSLYPSFPAFMELILPSLPDANEVVVLRKNQSFHFAPFVPQAVHVGMQAFQMCLIPCGAAAEATP